MRQVQQARKNKKGVYWFIYIANYPRRADKRFKLDMREYYSHLLVDTCYWLKWVYNLFGKKLTYGGKDNILLPDIGLNYDEVE